MTTHEALPGVPRIHLEGDRLVVDGCDHVTRRGLCWTSDYAMTLAAAALYAVPIVGAFLYGRRHPRGAHGSAA